MQSLHKISGRRLRRVIASILLVTWFAAGVPTLLEFDYAGDHYEFPSVEKARAATEIRRPTAHTASAFTTPGNAYDATGASTSGYVLFNNNTESTFYSWQSATETYTNLYLKFTYSSVGATTVNGTSDTYTIAYATDGCSGTFAYPVMNVSATRATTTETSWDLGGSQDLSQLCVKVTTTKNKGGDAGPPTLYLYDIWTEGTYSAQASPSASAVSIDSGASSVTLTESTTKSVVCAATVTDPQGYADITSVTANLFRTGVGFDAEDKSDNHYTLSGDSNCVPSAGSGNTETYTCTFAVQYYAEATDAASDFAGDNWTCLVTPSDSGGAGTTASDTIEINTLLALEATASLDYGNVGPGQNSGSSPQVITVTNTGNTDLDPQVSSSAAMACTEGTIPVANQEYSSSTFTYGSGTDLSSTPTVLSLGVFKRNTAGNTYIRDSYWGIGVPAAGVSGTCTGAITLTATAI